MKPSNLPKNINRPYQKTGSQVFLNKLLSKKRNVKNTRTVVRKYSKAVSILFPFLLLGVTIYLCYSYLDRKGFLDIRDFEIIGATKYVNLNDISSLVKTNIQKKKITNMDIKKLEILLKNNFLGAKNISVQRDSISKIRVIVEERVPLAVLFSTTNQKNYLIDGDGYVLGEVGADSINLPVVRYEKEVLVNSFVEKDLVPLTIQLLSLSEKEELKVSSISFLPNYMRLYVESGVEVLVDRSKDLGKLIEVVSSLIKRADLEGKRVSRIDLRYDKVIVSYD
jgi:cell division septal protein FtsQ